MFYHNFLFRILIFRAHRRISSETTSIFIIFLQQIKSFARIWTLEK